MFTNPLAFCQNWTVAFSLVFAFWACEDISSNLPEVESALAPSNPPLLENEQVENWIIVSGLVSCRDYSQPLVEVSAYHDSYRSGNPVALALSNEYGEFLIFLPQTGSYHLVAKKDARCRGEVQMKLHYGVNLIEPFRILCDE